MFTTSILLANNSQLKGLLFIFKTFPSEIQMSFCQAHSQKSTPHLSETCMKRGLLCFHHLPSLYRSHSVLSCNPISKKLMYLCTSVCCPPTQCPFISIFLALNFLFTAQSSSNEQRALLFLWTFTITSRHHNNNDENNMLPFSWTKLS